MDDPIFSQFALEAAKIKEGGRWAALNLKIVAHAENATMGNEWWPKLLGSLCFQVFSEFLRLQNAYEQERTDPALLAWRARNLLELSIWATYVASSVENARRFYEDAGRDAMECLQLFKNWGEKNDQPTDWLSVISVSQNNLSDQAASVGITDLSGKYMSVLKAAEECGLKEAFSTWNKLLSKFAHPTAMQILGELNDKTNCIQKETFFGLGCCFFIGAFNAFETSQPVVGQKLS